MSGADLEGNRSEVRPLASLGNETCFLDAILGEILQPQLSEAVARERAWGRRRDVAPSAPPLEVEEVEEVEDVTPITLGEWEVTAPEETLEGESHDETTLEESSSSEATSARLLELVTALADTLPPPPPDPCEMTRCDSWQFSSLVDVPVPDHPSGTSSPSTCTSFESLSRALDGLSTRASMYLQREHATLPPRPRSASPSVPVPPEEEDMDSFVTAVDEPEDSEGPSPRQPRVRSLSTGSQTPSDPLAKPSHRWLRMSMRRARPFRLDEPVAPVAPPPGTSRPSSAPVASTSRPSRGRRRRISSSTSRRRENAQNDPVSPDHSWTSHPISDDESVESTPRRQPRPENPFSVYEMPRDCGSVLGQWPHGLSSVLASLGCTLGLFNISRFAILSVQFGANFFLQFLIMSALVGIPLFTFHVSLGQLLAAGTMDMWRISPVFQGVGIALLLSQALLGIYSIVGVSWMFIYFRDSFITKQDIYRWAEPFNAYRDDGQSMLYNTTPVKIEETVPDYFSGVVLQRNLSNPGGSPGHLKFQATFNLAVVWMLVFISLSKGLKSYGKVVYLFSLVPVFGMLLFCSKLLGFMPADPKFQFLFPETEWSEFFLNTKSWVAASTEAFYTWGLLGAAAMQVASHNRPKHYLHRDTAIVIVFTLSILALSAFLANSCTQILLAHGYIYLPSSFERMSTYAFLHPVKQPLPHAYAGTPVRWLTHSQFVVGEAVAMPGTNPRQQSGYQALRLATELVPSTLALIGANNLSPFWSVLFYFVLILFGIAQQLAIWHCLITGIMAINIKKLKNWETTITFFTCACGFILGLPMATQFGIFVVYFLDYTVGGGWWILCLYLVEIMAVFMVRGRPYSGETVVTALFSRAGSFLQNFIAPLLSFVWNVILPVLMMVVFITIFKNGQFRDWFRWSAPMLYDYWPSWSREFGCLLQILPLLTIPFIGLVQSCRYLSDGPPDILDRIQMLYRPEMGSVASVLDFTAQTDVESSNAAVSNVAVEDPPPKYTPPPSYTTATGARIAKLLRQSFRRSMRRITTAIGGESSVPSARPRLPLPPPPDYSTVLVEMHQNQHTDHSEVIVNRTDHSTLTADDVATILRSSIRRPRDNVVESSSSERLVDAAAPINEDSIVLETVHIDKSLDLHRH
ncbi:sodium-dependent transporter bedraggled [Macrosteles quadrilineatus]|uniref:sodium-dependent transporter bedraggled n=1 Tax=Macrosteles quadrilineatus TaxID=74068 RepID=UPI0023E22E33|nr:sodium-dependent transporter bedraggled [Macrosteles quadrilineatus]